jgi:cytoskeletal protein CcmA (bactofilin family)
MMNVKKDAPVSQVGGMLGEGVTLEGVLTFAQTFRIDGDFKGKILRSDRLVVGEKGKVSGEIEVNSLVVYGSVEGQVHVKGAVEVHPKGRIRGDIAMQAPLLQVLEGGILDGTLKMNAKDGVVTPMPQKGQRE